MLYIDTKYITLVGAQLRNFKKKKNNLYNCSCPICGDSAKKKLKARGYFYEYNNSSFYKCHNCHASMSLSLFLKNYFSALHDSYAIEKFSDESSPKPPKPTSSILALKPKNLKLTNSRIDQFAHNLDSLEDSHVAKLYIKSRLISKEHYKNLYYADDFSKLVLSLFPDTQSALQSDARLIIPFYDKDKNLIAIQGRALDKNCSLRYITIKANQDSNIIYGLDRFDISTQGYVVEGPIDSLFIPNCLATANSNLELACNRISNDLILIYDNEPKNKEIVKLIESSINHNRRVCIWPKNILCKDVNDMILSGMSSNQLLSIITSRTFTGLSAMLEFNQWKKI